LAVWAGLGPLYDRVIIAVTSAVLGVTEHPPMSDLRPDGNDVILNRLDFPKSMGMRPSISLSPLTYNIILLVGLFAMAPRPFSDRNVLHFFLAALALMVVHVLALICQIESIYAVNIVGWSEKHYGPIARNVWSGAAHFYDLFGIPAVAFALWFLFSDYALPIVAQARRRKGS